VILNNFQVFMDAGYACASKGYTSMFFGGFYMVVVFLVMNLLSSFVLESVISSFDSADASYREPHMAPMRAQAPSTDDEPATTPAALYEAAADEADRFARACAERLRAEGNTSVVSVVPQQSDGYASLVRLLAGQGGGAHPSLSTPSQERAAGAGVNAGDLDPNSRMNVAPMAPLVFSPAAG